jgi:hypothetical protein
MAKNEGLISSHDFELSRVYCVSHDEWERCGSRSGNPVCTGCGHAFREGAEDEDDEGLCAYCGAPYL